MQKNWLKNSVIFGIIMLLIISGFVSALYENSFIHSNEKNIEIIQTQNQSLPSNNFADTWSIETVDGSSDVGQYTDIAVTADSIVFISYHDFSKKDLKCTCLINNVWKTTVVDSEGNVGLYTSLALDSNDHPHISYYDATQQTLKHAYFNGGD